MEYDNSWMDCNVLEVTRKLGNEEWTWLHEVQYIGTAFCSLKWTMLADREGTAKLRQIGSCSNLIVDGADAAEPVVMELRDTDGLPSGIILSDEFIRIMEIEYDAEVNAYFALDGERKSTLVACFEGESFRIRTSYLKRYAFIKKRNIVIWFYFAETRPRGGFGKGFDNTIKCNGVEARLWLHHGDNREEDHVIFQGVKVIFPKERR